MRGSRNGRLRWFERLLLEIRALAHLDAGLTERFFAGSPRPVERLLFAPSLLIVRAVDGLLPERLRARR